MKFDYARALDYTRRIAFPRRVGSRGEIQARQTIQEWFTNLGYEVNLQEFNFSDSFERWLKLEILAGQLLVLGALIVPDNLPGLSLVFGSLVLVLLVLTPLLHRKVLAASLHNLDTKANSVWPQRVQGLGKEYRSANIVASPPCPAAEGRPKLVLMAHYDSKSQSLSLPARVAAIIIVAVGGISFSASIILATFTGLPEIVPVIFGGLTIISGIPLLILKNANDSPGALDNGSGIGILMHLAEILAKQDEIHQKLDIEFAATGAEEFALMGARAYLQNRFDQALEGQFILLNFDGPGGEGRLTLSGKTDHRRGKTSPTKLLSACLAEHGASPISINIPGLLMDHMPFQEAGMEACTLSSLGWQGRFVHTTADNIKRLSPTSTGLVGQAILAFIEKLALDRQAEILDSFPRILPQLTKKTRKKQ